jgi:hypothetical protein
VGRVGGGGDAFASSAAHLLLTGSDPNSSLSFAAALLWTNPTGVSLSNVMQLGCVCLPSEFASTSLPFVRLSLLDLRPPTPCRLLRPPTLSLSSSSYLSPSPPFHPRLLLPSDPSLAPRLLARAHLSRSLPLPPTRLLPQPIGPSPSWSLPG